VPLKKNKSFIAAESSESEFSSDSESDGGVDDEDEGEDDLDDDAADGADAAGAFYGEGEITAAKSKCREISNKLKYNQTTEGRENASRAQASLDAVGGALPVKKKVISDKATGTVISGGEAKGKAYTTEEKRKLKAQYAAGRAEFVAQLEMNEKKEAAAEASKRKVASEAAAPAVPVAAVPDIESTVPQNIGGGRPDIVAHSVVAPPPQVDDSDRSDSAHGPTSSSSSSSAPKGISSSSAHAALPATSSTANSRTSSSNSGSASRNQDLAHSGALLALLKNLTRIVTDITRTIDDEDSDIAVKFVYYFNSKLQEALAGVDQMTARINDWEKDYTRQVRVIDRMSTANSRKTGSMLTIPIFDTKGEHRILHTTQTFAMPSNVAKVIYCQNAFFSFFT